MTTISSLEQEQRGHARSIETSIDQPSQDLARGLSARVSPGAGEDSGASAPEAGSPQGTPSPLAPGRQDAAPVNGQTGAAPARSGDTELVRRAIVGLKQGDRSALHFLYLRYADEVRRYVGGIVRDPHETEDITQTVFAKLLTAIRRYEPRDVPFAAWVMRVARNAALDHLRARRQLPCGDIHAIDEGYEQLERHRSRALCEAFRRLPPEQREVLVLRHIAGLSPVEIARRIGKSESAVHGLHHRGRGAMQLALQELDATPTVAG